MAGPWLRRVPVGFRRGWTLLLMAGVLTGCRTVEFYSQAVGGQVEVLAKRQEIGRVVAETEDGELRQRLILTKQVLKFAQDELEISSGGSYECYTDLGRDHLVWVVFAAPELAMEPKQWWYPVVGCQDYRGYFREDSALAEADRLRAAGYETWINEVDAYSTLGWFRDPVMNTFVHRDEVDYVELIFHELCHQKHFVRHDTSFSEGLAEAVAREAVRRWYRATGRPELVKKYEARLERLEQSREAIEGTVDQLRVIYASSISDEEKRARKAIELKRLRQRLTELRAEWNGGLVSWIEDPVNNARLNSFITYEAEVQQFVDLLEECEGDFGLFWKRVKGLDRKERAGGGS